MFCDKEFTEEKVAERGGKKYKCTYAYTTYAHIHTHAQVCIQKGDATMVESSTG